MAYNALLLRENSREKRRPTSATGQHDTPVPTHLLRVLVSEQTRTVCPFHRLVEEFDHVDKDLAFDMAEGFLTVGMPPTTGVWKADASKSSPQKTVHVRLLQ